MSTTWRKCRRTRTKQASPRGARMSKIREFFEPESSSASDSGSESPSPPPRRRHGFRKLVKKMVGRPRNCSIAPESSSPPKEYVGVRYRVKLNKYVTEIRPTKSTKKIWLGTYDTAEEAARAFDIGNLCCKKNLPLNFPDSPGMLRKISSRLSPDQARNAIAKLAKEVAHVDINVAPDETVDRAAAQKAHDLVQRKSQRSVGSPEPRTQHFEVDGAADITYTEETPLTHHVVAVMEELDLVATSMPLSAGGEGGSGGQAWSFDVTQVFVDDERASFPLHKLINFGPDPPQVYGEVLYHYHA